VRNTNGTYAAQKLTMMHLNISLQNQLGGRGTQNEYWHFEQHPSITRGHGPEPDRCPYSRKHQHHRRIQRQWKLWKKRLATQHNTHDIMLRRLQHWRQADRDIGPAMQQTNWKSIWENTDSDARDRMEGYRWRIGAYSTYTDKGIPSCEACNSEDTLMHIMWHCPKAQTLWKIILHALGITITHVTEVRRFKQSILLDKAPKAGSELLRYLGSHSNNPQEFTIAYDNIWGQFTRMGRRALWKWRNQRIWNDNDGNPHQQAAQIRLNMQLLLFNRLAHPSIALRAHYKRMEEWINDSSTLGSTTTNSNQFRLFFDGGARGNPGKAGSGAMLQKQWKHRWKPIWCASSYLPETTNNRAEYLALLEGLQEAQRRAISHLTIIGDSQLILRQLEGQYKVKSPSTQKLYYEIQQLLHHLTTFQVHHTMRMHNSTADALANVAMDTQRSNKHSFHQAAQSADWLPPDLAALMENDNNYSITI
jgi:ribonuclease HI